MSKIEVLRLPDERRQASSKLWPADSLMVEQDGLPVVIVRPEWKPALLAALLEDAGAVKVVADNAGRIEGPVPALWIPGHGKRTQFWLLPVPEDTEE